MSEIEDLSSYGNEQHVDISLPDMPVPEASFTEVKEIKDEFDGAFKFNNFTFFNIKLLYF